MRTGNPTLNEKVFLEASRDLESSTPVMTIEGTLLKTSILLASVLLTSILSWQQAHSPQAMIWLWVGLIGTLTLGLVTSFKPKLAPVLAIPHSLCEGAFLGILSASYAARFSGERALGGMAGGIVFQAVTLTFGVAFAMLALYHFRVIRVTQRLRSIVYIGTAGIFGMYLISFLLRLFMGSSPIGFLHSSGPVGILYSLAVVGLAAFNLLVDFDLIERGARRGAPKYMEWYGGFALIVTLAWLYFEVIRLLAKLQSRR